MASSFVALDFETADLQHDSACAVALVRVEDNRVVRRFAHLIRPPRRDFSFSHVHGITWPRVARSPSFRDVWPLVQPLLRGVEVLAAHNASFDQAVLEACCRAAGIESPRLPFVCTMKLARRVWRIRPTSLPDVCQRLGIPLQHHDAASDANACARIMIAAREREATRRTAAATRDRPLESPHRARR